MPTLSEDLTVEILSRLPVKTLTRFKSVSKYFNSFISEDSIFLQLHRLHSQKNPCFLFPSLSFHTSTLLLDSFDPRGKHINRCKKITFDDDMLFFDLIPSSHHLVCIALGFNNINIFNPSTEDIVRLPPSSISTNDSPSLGFAYLPAKKQYKLVKFKAFSDIDHIYYDANSGTRVEIFEITTPTNNLREVVYSGRWRLLEESFPYPTSPTPETVDGYLFWEVSYMNLWEGNREGIKMIISLNLEDEKFQTLTPPPSVVENGSGFRLAGIRGHLWLVEYIENIDSLGMWVLKDFENQDSWMQKWRIDYSGIKKGIQTMYPLDLRDEEEVLFRIVPYGLAWYNLKNKIITRWIHQSDKIVILYCYYTEGFLAH